MALSGPFASFVAIAGLIFAGITVVSVIVIMALIQNCNRKIQQKQAEVKEVENQITAIGAARSELIKLGEQDFEIFKDSINVLAQTWLSVGADAQDIQNHLKNSLEYPESEKESLLDSRNIYLGMASYLQNYARGITSASALKSL